jgi:hypothetical protein
LEFSWILDMALGIFTALAEWYPHGPLPGWEIIPATPHDGIGALRRFHP